MIEVLLTEGHALNDILIYGDSSGGGLAAAAVLKMRGRSWACQWPPYWYLPGWM